MPEKELNPGQIQLLWTGVVGLLTIVWGVLTKRIIDLPRDYVLRERYVEDRKEMNSRFDKLEEKMEEGIEKIYVKLEEKRDYHRRGDA